MDQCIDVITNLPDYAVSNGLSVQFKFRQQLIALLEARTINWIIIIIACLAVGIPRGIFPPRDVHIVNHIFKKSRNASTQINCISCKKLLEIIRVLNRNMTTSNVSVKW